MDEREDRVDALIEEFLEAQSDGRATDPEDLLARHPELEEPLRLRLAALRFVDRAFAATSGTGALPERIGEYRIVREIGRGGMGVVFEAEQTSLGRPVALKVLSLAITSTPEAVRRFRREARSAARLHHTNIVPVYGLGEQDGQWYYAMELVRGRALSRVIEEARGDVLGQASTLSAAGAPGTGAAVPAPGEPASVRGSSRPEDRAYFARVAGMFAAVADGLHLAHGEGIVHRDVKPANLMLTSEGVLKLVDFGLAHVEEAGPTLTRVGSAIGTPAYMSPEQARGRAGEVDFRSDIYSLGATLYEVLTLRPPFQGRSHVEVLQQVWSQDPALPRHVNPRIPRDLETVVLRAMEKDPARRYASALEMARDLERFAVGAAIQARPIGPLGRAWRRVRRHRVRSALAATALVLLATAAWLWVSAAAETRRRTALEYRSLVAQGEAEVAGALAAALRGAYREVRPYEVQPGAETGAEFPETVAMSEALSSAIALDPGPPDAWWLRALVPNRALEARLADVEEARRRGLDPGTAALERAYVLGREGRLSEEEMRGALAAPDVAGDPRASFFRADLLWGAGRPDEALLFLGQAVTASRPGSAIHHLALRMRAELHRLRDEHDLALADLFAVRALGEDSPHVRLAIVRAWEKKGSPAPADDLFRRTLEEAASRGDRNHWLAVVGASRALLSLPRYEAALDAASSALPEEPRLLSGRADLRAHRGDLAGARRLSDEAIARAPDDPETLTRHAVLLGALGDLDGALATLARVKDLTADGHVALEREARVLLDAGRTADGIARLEEAHARDRRCPSCLQLLAHAYMDAGRPDEGFATWDRLLRIQPRSAVAYAERGARRWNHFQDAEGALADFDRSLAISPDLPFAHWNKVIVLRSVGRYGEAEASARRARELAPEHAPIREGYVLALLHVGRWEQALAEAEDAVRSLPDEPAVWRARASARLDLRRLPEALEDARKALELDPADRESLYRIALVESAMKRHEDALGHVRAALAKRETSAARNLEATCLDELKRDDEALVSYARAIEMDPLNPVPHGNRAKLLRDRGDLDGALAAVEEALRLRDTAVRRVERLQDKSDLLLRMGRPDEAAAILDQAVSEFPDLPGGYVNRGAFRHDRLKDAARAAADFERAVQLDPSLAVAWQNLCIARRSLGLHDPAIAAARRALEIDPGATKARWLLAQSLRDAGRQEEAIPVLRAGYDADPRNAWLLDILVCMIDLGRWEDTIAVADEILARWPSNADALHDKACALANLGKPAEALAVYDRMSELDPRDPVPWYRRAFVHGRLREREKQVAAHRKAMELAPKWSWPRNDLGVVLLNEGKPADALALFDEAARLAPTDPVPRRNRATAFLDLGEHEKALAAAREAAEVEPDGGDTLRLLADVHWHLGQRKEALVPLERALRTDPEGRTWTYGMMLDILSEMRDFERLLEAAARAEADVPRRLYFPRMRVAALRALGRDDDARDAARVAVAGDPVGEPPEPRHLAYLLAVAGEGDRALATLEAEGPDSSPIARMGAAIVHAVLGDEAGVAHWLGRYVAADGPKFPPGSALDPDLLRMSDDPQVAPLLAKIAR